MKLRRLRTPASYVQLDSGSPCCAKALNAAWLPVNQGDSEPPPR